ncbi:MAG: OmpA family protein [Holosporales bacterium]|jgi:chemotaxis protein MotB|nr:OmpA family protein [Holosporales bacterium]
MIFNNRKEAEFNVWPCFVDVLSSLLILIIFIIIGFFISQVYLSNALNNSDTSLRQLQALILNLREKIAKTESDNLDLQKANHSLEDQLRTLVAQINSLQVLFNQTKGNEDNLRKENKSFSEKIEELTAHITKLNALLEAERNAASKRETDIKASLGAEITKKIAELERISAELDLLRKQIPDSILQNPSLLKYRSEFFALLQNVIGGRSDIRVVGDRFVFQSEVLFEQGSNSIGYSGQNVLNALVKILKEITEKIPPEIHWVLVVDGHTDRVPIHNDRFDSNWELSSARAISVVKFLISKGIPPQHLAAASFAEFFPLTNDQAKMAKNRRIEIRLDQR